MSSEKELKGSRSSKEASVVLSSVEVEAQRLDSQGKVVGEPITLSTLRLDREAEEVDLYHDGQVLSAPGWKFTMRDRGRDSRTTSVKMFYQDAVVDPDPTPDTTDPSAVTNLRATEVTATGFELAWDAATDDVGVVSYEVMVDGDFHVSNRANELTTSYVAQASGEAYQVQVYAADAAGNSGEPAELVVTTLTPEPDPDTTKPSTPGNLRATSVVQTGFTLEWDPATDDVGVSGYHLSINGGGPGPVNATRYVFVGEPGLTYAVELWALDAAGNASTPARLRVTTPTPPPPPPTGTWPAAGTVGFKGDRSKLTRMRGGQITTAGTVIENRLIDCTDSGELGVKAANVTIRNCVVLCGGWGVFLYNPFSGLVIEDCTFEGAEYAGVGLSQAPNWRISRCDFSGGNDAIKPGGSGVIEDCRMHDPYRGENSHNDCIQFSGNCDGITVRRNYLGGADTSEIAMFPGQGGVYRNVTIENNFLGGAGYAIYAGGKDGHNVVIRNNVFGSYGYQHPVTNWQRKAGNEFVGNTFERNGQAVPVPPHES